MPFKGQPLERLKISLVWDIPVVKFPFLVSRYLIQTKFLNITNKGFWRFAAFKYKCGFVYMCTSAYVNMCTNIYVYLWICVHTAQTAVTSQYPIITPLLPAHAQLWWDVCHLIRKLYPKKSSAVDFSRKKNSSGIFRTLFWGTKIPNFIRNIIPGQE